MFYTEGQTTEFGVEGGRENNSRILEEKMLFILKENVCNILKFQFALPHVMNTNIISKQAKCSL